MKRSIINMVVGSMAAQTADSRRRLLNSHSGSNVPEAEVDSASKQNWSSRSPINFAPDFFVIGAMKAGTTTLHQYLKQFPEVSLPRSKETDYFLTEEEHSLGESWYRRQFNFARPLLGEVSPNYTKFDIFPGVPNRIFKRAPSAKLIFIARDPVERFAAHYRHSWSFGYTRIKPANLLQSDSGRHMIQCSLYSTQIERFFQFFGPSQFLFLDFKNLCMQPQFVCNEVADFLEINRKTMQTVRPENTADQVARIPGFAKRAARSSMIRRFDYLIPDAQRKLLRHALSFQTLEKAPDLGSNILDEVANILRVDAQRFRELSGMEFEEWRA